MNGTIIQVEQVKNEVLSNSIFNEILSRFLGELETTEITKKSYAKKITRFINWTTNNNITKPERKDIIRYRDEMQGHELKPTTIRSYISAIKVFFKWLSRNELYKDISDGIKGAKVSGDYKKDFFNTQQVRNILSSISKGSKRGVRDYALMTLLFTCGLRTIEIVRANIEDLRTSGDHTVLYVQGKGKDEKTDFVIVSGHVEQAIRNYLKQRPQAEGKDPLFSSISNNNSGQRLTTRSIRGTVKSIFRDAGYDSSRLTAHSCRHTAITLALLSGETLEQAQQFARHADIKTTQVYAHHLDRNNNTCSQSVSNSIFQEA